MIAVSNRMWIPVLLYVCVSDWDSLLNPDLRPCRHFPPCNLCCTTSSVHVVWKWHRRLYSASRLNPIHLTAYSISSASGCAVRSSNKMSIINEQAANTLVYDHIPEKRMACLVNLNCFSLVLIGNCLHAIRNKYIKDVPKLRILVLSF